MEVMMRMALFSDSMTMGSSYEPSRCRCSEDEQGVAESSWAAGTLGIMFMCNGWRSGTVERQKWK